MEHPLLQTYGPLDGWMILLLIGGVSISFFLYQVQLATRLVMLGASDSRFDSWGQRIKEVITGWLGQKRVLEDRIVGGMHVLMFWGFLMLSTDMFDLATAIGSLTTSYQIFSMGHGMGWSNLVTP